MFRPGEVVPQTAPYLVRHFKHRAEHVATAVVGGVFPECRQCKAAARFTPLDPTVFRAHAAIDTDPDFAPQNSFAAKV
jgi:hypothetical protein